MPNEGVEKAGEQESPEQARARASHTPQTARVAPLAFLLVVLGMVLAVPRGGAGSWFDGVVMIALLLLGLLLARPSPGQVGWLAILTLVGAAFGRLVALSFSESISVSPSDELRGTEYIFYGAAGGLGAGLIAFLWQSRFQFRIRHLLELTVAVALLMTFWRSHADAQAQVDLFEHAEQAMQQAIQQAQRQATFPGNPAGPNNPATPQQGAAGDGQ